MADHTENAKLHGLADKWLRVARCKFESADAEADPMGRRLIEHGATCYFNAANELRGLIETGDAPADLELQVLDENAKRP